MPDLLEFGAYSNCPKCQNIEVRIAFCDGKVKRAQIGIAGGLYDSRECLYGECEHLHVICQTCGWEWATVCADSGVKS